MPHPLLRVGIVEDQLLVLNLLVDLCRHRFGWDVVAAESTAKTARAAILETKPDAVLIDINLPDEDGITLALSIRAKLPGTKLIILSAESTEFTIFRVRQSGLHGFIDKNTDPDQIKIAITNVIERNHPFFSPLVKTIARCTVTDSLSFDKVLSDREQELLPLLGMGYSDTEIAILKSLAPDTARKHRDNIMKKLSLRTAPELVHYCIEKGFLQTRPDGDVRPSSSCLSSINSS